MPKAPIDENCDFRCREIYIRPSGQILGMQTIFAQASRAQIFTDKKFRFGVLTFDTPHYFGTYIFREDISQGAYPDGPLCFPIEFC